LPACAQKELAVPEVAPQSAWAPLRITVFRWLWIAGMVSNIGTFMQNVGAAWLMTDLTRSPTLISLLQTAYAVPGFLLALVAGALADVVDRRRLLLVTQTFMFAVAAVLGLLSITDQVTTTSLLFLTFLLSVGGTLNMPAWVSLTPELVPREQLTQAVALNSISMNIAQSIGPAIAGVLIAVAGTGAVFMANAVSFLAVVGVVAVWKREPQQTTMPAEHITAAIRTGIRYVAHAPALITLLARLALFILFSSSLAALLPVVARNRLGLSAGGFGLLSASLGVGAIAMASQLPRARARLSADQMVLAGSALFGVALMIVAQSTTLLVACIGLALGGAGSIVAMTTVFATFQAVLPSWVRGRGLAVAMLTVWLVTAPASYGWGSLASDRGVSTALTIAAIGVLATALLAAPFLRIGGLADVDLTPVPTALPVMVLEPAGSDGPVLVTVEWRIDPADTDRFAEAMAPIRRQRRRDGAMTWGLFHDVTDPGRMIESFSVASWAEHERQHERTVAGDGEGQAAARALLVGSDAPLVTHLIGTHRPRPPRRSLRASATRS